MIVYRTYGTVKRGRLEEAVAFLKEASAGITETVRIYSPYVGDNDLVCMEVELEDLAHYESWAKEYVMNPEAQEGLKGWFELTTALRSEVMQLR